MPTVSCATVDTSVAHHTPSPSGSVPRASAPVTAPTLYSTGTRIQVEALGVPTSAPEPTSHSTAPTRSIRSPIRRPASLESSQVSSSRAVSSSPTWLGLDHTSSVVSTVPGCQPSPFPSAHGHQPSPVTGVLSMPSFTAHCLRGTAPSSTSPANATGASVAGLWPRPHSGALAPSTRTANPACSRLASLRAARS